MSDLSFAFADASIYFQGSKGAVQWASALHAFFKLLADKYMETQIQDTSVAHPIFQPYLSRFCSLLRYQEEFWDEPDPLTIMETVSILELVKGSLQKLLLDETYWETEPTHCLFYCASYFFYYLHYDYICTAELRITLDAIHPLWKEYKQRANIIPLATRTGSFIEVGSRI